MTSTAFGTGLAPCMTHQSTVLCVTLYTVHSPVYCAMSHCTTALYTAQTLHQYDTGPLHDTPVYCAAWHCTTLCHPVYTLPPCTTLYQIISHCPLHDTPLLLCCVAPCTQYTHQSTVLRGPVHSTLHKHCINITLAPCMTHQSTMPCVTSVPV